MTKNEQPENGDDDPTRIRRKELMTRLAVELIDDPEAIGELEQWLKARQTEKVDNERRKFEEAAKKFARTAFLGRFMDQYGEKLRSIPVGLINDEDDMPVPQALIDEIEATFKIYHVNLTDGGFEGIDSRKSRAIRMIAIDGQKALNVVFVLEEGKITKISFSQGYKESATGEIE